ncbi:hypothetical protein FRC10_012082 [Ceratobasidium sp. 414]|nr:hypothetical protein FRC10_012082 [Ceratobasidium sp. 414]
MPRSLPTELLALVAGCASESALAALSQISRTAYAVSVGPLYASIASMSAMRTIQCLRTLTLNPHLAQLVRLYTINTPFKELRRYDVFTTLVTCALENMINLAELSLHLGVSCTSTVFKRATFKLHKLVCVIVSDPTYPISRFLESQPAIESLYLVCRPEGFTGLSPTALPALRDVAAPLDLLPQFIIRDLSQINRVSSLGTIASPLEIRKLAVMFSFAPTRPPGSIELVLGLDLGVREMSPDNVGSALAVLGDNAPGIGLLRLEVHKGHVKHVLMSESLTFALHHYPSLHTLVVMSQPKPQPRTQTRAYIHPDAVHDSTLHTSYLAAWHAARPSLERVVLPIGVYTYVKKGGKKDRGGGSRCDQKDCLTCRELAEDKRGWVPLSNSRFPPRIIH